MTDSNFYVLRYRLYKSKREKNRRLAILQNTLAQLEAYHRKPGLKPNRMSTVSNLIIVYSTFLTIQGA